MATRQRNNVAYGLSDPLLGTPAFPIVSKRAPTSNDQAQLGTLWIDRTDVSAYVLASNSGGTSTWLDIAGGGGSFTSLTVNPGNITATAGNIVATAGSVSAGTTVSAGTSVSAGTTVVAGTGITATTGSIVASTGNITATAGSISANLTVTAGTGITATTGSITASTGNVVSSSGAVIGVGVYASGDNGGIAAENSFTNVVNTTQGVGVGTILMTTGSNNNNTGFIKMYVGTTPVFVPYFVTIT